MDLVVDVDAFPRAGETIFGRSFTTVGGGKGLNQAIAARRAAADVRFVGAVGVDAYGTQL
ncbi:MAG: ribokinase, partial [Propionibacteriaceae bacterium]|nr:ribokinase [Propionibacteriaceae bacterium]